MPKAPASQKTILANIIVRSAASAADNLLLDFVVRLDLRFPPRKCTPWRALRATPF
jgi:hypothetical protein